MKGNILRGKVLRLLGDLYPAGIEETGMVGIYYQYDKVDDIICAAAYLCDKGLVRKTQTPHPYKKQQDITCYKITARGIDLLEGTIPAEAGISVPREG
ncbi:MAG: hypothetical protein K2H09_08735 [Treponemataceae bacterium]|nr:hypothetical protein [Treponemataceae bacterium]